ncbi:MAG: DUF2085 domain-containing protein [Candidatus Schekmanbacteria bacterium]|nr:DUF2085 domain-containing protein [Candidatus Schekmanbacteria bacterium]
MLPAATLFWGGTIAAPLFDAAHDAGGVLLRLFYSALCHQIPARSLAVGDFPMAVCARCEGLYFGALAGLAVTLLAHSCRPPSAALFAACVAANAADALLASLALPSAGNVLRLLLGLAAGIAAGCHLGAALRDLDLTLVRTAVSGRGRRVACADP